MRRVVILFPSEWLAYSPTILNLVETLRPTVLVKVVGIDNGKYDNSQLDPEIFHLVRVPKLLFQALALVRAYRHLKCWLLAKSIMPMDADIVIGVDNLGVLSALAIYDKVHFLSLEIERGRTFQRIDWARVLSIAIQSEMRLNYLFPKGAPAPVFFLPNTPIIHSLPDADAEGHGGRLILFGNLVPGHGIFECIDAVAEMGGVTLTLKGPMRASVRREITTRYERMIHEKRLYMDTTYVPQEAVMEYLQQFDIGFCFYRSDILEKGDFNYISSPSGKLYNYFGAGVPVIGSKVLGLEDVTRFAAGILLENLSPTSIRDAIRAVLKDQERFRRGCLSAAVELDFSRHALPYKSHLVEFSYAQ